MAVPVQWPAPPHLLPGEPVIARDVFHQERAGAALDELDAESIQTGKTSLGRCDQRYLPPAVHVGEKPAVRERDLDHSRDGSPEWGLLHIGADVLRKNPRGDLYLAFPFIRSRADPVLDAVSAFVADKFDQFGIDSQFGPDGDRPGPCGQHVAKDWSRRAVPAGGYSGSQEQLAGL